MFGSCWCSSEVMPDGSCIVVIVGEKGIVGRRSLNFECVDCRSPWRMALLSSLETSSDHLVALQHSVGCFAVIFAAASAVFEELIDGVGQVKVLIAGARVV